MGLLRLKPCSILLNQKSGIALVEVLIAFSLLMLMLTSCVGLLGRLYYRVEKKAEHIVLMQHLTNAVTYLKQIGYEKCLDLARHKHYWEWDGKTLPLGTPCVDYPLYQVQLALIQRDFSQEMHPSIIDHEFSVSLYAQNNQNKIGNYVFFY